MSPVLNQLAKCCRITWVVLLALAAIGLPALSGADEACHPDGDVDQSGQVTTTDARLVFQQALSLGELTSCQKAIADVFREPSAPDGRVTAADAFCILWKVLGLRSCLDSLPPSGELPFADAGPDLHVTGGMEVRLSGSGSDSDGKIVSYAWEQTGGTMVSITTGDDSTAVFTAPEVSVEETLTFRLTVTDENGATSGDEVSVTVGIGFASSTSLSAGHHHACVVREPGPVECWGSDEYGQSAPPSGTFTSLSAGLFHTCGVRNTGVVECWGDNDYGQSTPPEGAFVSVDGGFFHTCGIRLTGAVVCWGTDGQGQSTPPPGTFASVSAGIFHTCGVRDTGLVTCWGGNDHGQSTPPSGTFCIGECRTLPHLRPAYDGERGVLGQG